MLHKLSLCTLLFLWCNLNSSTITISKVSDMFSLSYEFPSIVPDNWINDEKISSVDPYKCHYQFQQQSNSLITSHSCVLTVDLRLENFYNYDFLHASKTIFKQSTGLILQDRQILPASVPYRLSLDISRADALIDITADIYVTFTMANVFQYVVHFNESVHSYQFRYDFSLPMPEDILNVFDHLDEVSSIDFSSNSQLELRISSYIIQDGNVLPNQNFFWNHRMLKLSYSNLSVDYIDSI